MSLTSGSRVGPYEVISEAGAGGMGEVYRARDTRLDRTVAIKILPPHLSDNPDAKQRFDREARESTPDGRILVAIQSEQEIPSPLTMVLNWDAEIKK
jgi:serine/threonine protein kinase